ncbi:hypothetical protein GCM10018965_098350 [Nonomuraea roseola]
MVDDEHQPLVALGQPDHARPPQRRLVQLEGQPGVRARQRVELPLGLLGRQAAEVGVGEGDRQLGHDHLDEAPVLDGQGRAQRLVPPDHLPQRPGAPVVIGAVGQVDHDVDVVHRHVGVEPGQEPQAFLRVGGGKDV